MAHLSQELLKALAPGTEIRDGLERIRRGHTGALIVLGFDDEIAELCDGGFEIDAAFTATRLRELCKMDGAVVLSTDGNRIRRANVQLVPDPALPTEESGTRHRSAERTALQTGKPVIAVSRSMNVITVYAEGKRHILRDSADILTSATHTLGAIERYRQRLDQEEAALFDAELSGIATAIDVAGVLSVSEFLQRTSDKVALDVTAAGKDGHQLDVQLRGLISGLTDFRTLILNDYLVTNQGLPTDEDILAANTRLSEMSEEDLLSKVSVAQVLGFPNDVEALNEHVDPRGFRALARVPRVQRSLMRKLAERYVTLPLLLEAKTDDLAEVPGVGPLWARHIRKGLEKLG